MRPMRVVSPSRVGTPGHSGPAGRLAVRLSRLAKLTRPGGVDFARAEYVFRLARTNDHLDVIRAVVAAKRFMLKERNLGSQGSAFGDSTDPR